MLFWIVLIILMVVPVPIYFRAKKMRPIDDDFGYTIIIKTALAMLVAWGGAIIWIIIHV